MTDENRFCLIPESGLNVMPSGNITPCCVTQFKLGHISTDSLSSVFHGPVYTEFREAHRRGELPQVCLDKCVNVKNNFVHINSRNQMMRDAERTGAKTPGVEKLITLDIGIGNVCNLTCVFCDEAWSSSWAKEKNIPSSIFSFNKDTILGIARDLKGMTSISFKGGEPFNMPHLDEFLAILYENNPDCHISIITNGTETTNSINKELFKFSNIISISSEATGELYQYMRGGKYKWENVLANIQKFADHGCKGIHLSSIISLYNYKTWAKDMMTIQNQVSSIVDHFDISAQLCWSPFEQSLFLLNLEQRQWLVESIKQSVADGLQLDGAKEMCESILINRKVDTTKEKILANIEYNNKLRGMDLFSIVEDFTPFIELDQH